MNGNRVMNFLITITVPPWHCFSTSVFLFFFGICGTFGGGMFCENVRLAMTVFKVIYAYLVPPKVFENYVCFFDLEKFTLISFCYRFFDNRRRRLCFYQSVQLMPFLL